MELQERPGLNMPTGGFSKRLRMKVRVKARKTGIISVGIKTHPLLQTDVTLRNAFGNHSACSTGPTVSLMMSTQFGVTEF